MTVDDSQHRTSSQSRFSTATRNGTAVAVEATEGDERPSRPRRERPHATRPTTGALLILRSPATDHKDAPLVLLTK